MTEITIHSNIYLLIFFSFMLLVIGACLFLIGYLYGRSQNAGVYDNAKPLDFFSRNANQNNVIKSNISIDEGKFVTDITTEDLSKKYDSLGETKQSSENIDSSVNKLKNLKR